MVKQDEAKRISQQIDAFDRDHTLHLRRRSAEHPSLYNEMDDFICGLSIPGRLQFKALGEKWREIGKGKARSTLRYMLGHDLAYCRSEIPDEDAGRLADAFLALFGAEVKYFTNGNLDTDTGNWAGSGFLTDATFEAGVVVVDRLHIGILWCHDED